MMPWKIKKLNAAQELKTYLLFKVLRPDIISDPAGRGITFSKKAGI